MSDTSHQPRLEITGLAAGYGRRRVVEEVSFAIQPGEVLAMIGHNGAGKTTLLQAIVGLLPRLAGSVRLDGVELPGSLPRAALTRGLVYLPQGQRVFGDLTVRENLLVGLANFTESRTATEARIQAILTEFPLLRGRLESPAAALSGGERQMVALARALLAQPRALLVDEPCLGLATELVPTILGRLRSLAQEGGLAVLVTEHRVRAALGIADRALVLRQGGIVYWGTAAELRRDTERLRQVYVGVSPAQQRVTTPTSHPDQ